MAKQKLAFGKIVGLSVLVIALAVGVALTQESQNLEEKAFNPRPMPVITGRVRAKAL